MHSNPNVIESHFPMTPEWDVSGELAKRRTEMPFPEPSREAPTRKCTEATAIPRTEGQNEDPTRPRRGPRSMDNSKGPLGASSLGTPEDLAERL